MSPSAPPGKGAGAAICVFCGSRCGFRPEYTRAASQLGQALGERQLGLVYGGGNAGLMGLLADAALAHGAHVTGVIPRALVDQELAHPGLQELVVVDNMHQRKAAMAVRAHAFVALPGGFGTLEELFEAVAWAQLGLHRKPVALLNTRGYFDHLIAFLDHAVREAFLGPHHLPLVRVDAEVDRLLDDVLAAPMWDGRAARAAVAPRPQRGRQTEERLPGPPA